MGRMGTKNVEVSLLSCITKGNIILFSFWAIEHSIKKLEHYLKYSRLEEIKGGNGDLDFGSKSSVPFVLDKEILNEYTYNPNHGSVGMQISGGLDTSSEHYHNMHGMQSSDCSQSRQRFLSYGEESKPIEVTKEVVLESETCSQNKVKARLGKVNSFPIRKSKPPSGKMLPTRTFSMKGEIVCLLEEINHGNDDSLEAWYIGSYLLNLSKDLVSSGENPQKALDLALQAMKSFDKCSDWKSSLELVMCLHVVASLYCKLGKYEEAIPLLERAIDIPNIYAGQDHPVAKFAGCMQLGDTYAMIGQVENSLVFYTDGLEIQRQVLGEKDLEFGETCRYIAEAHVQISQFDEAEKLCKLALDIHREKGSSPLQEARVRRLMGIICDSKGDHEIALEHYALAGVGISATVHENEAALVDRSIGDAYLSLARYDEAIVSYKKALNLIKFTKGENHPWAASVFVRLAGLYNKIGKYRESKSYCEHAVCIYSIPCPVASEEVASGLIDVSGIYESMDEFEQALKLLQKATKMYENIPDQQTTVAGIRAQMGALYYLMGSYSDSYHSFKYVISTFREIGTVETTHFGVILNQLGLSCVQLYAINEAADLFKESISILEKEYGPYHPETLSVYSNLAGTYDAMGRSSDAIEILEYIVEKREHKLGTANADGDEEKWRLAELLKETGRVRNRKSRSLEALLETNYESVDEDDIKEL